MIGAGAFCGVHPTVGAAITCQRCGSFACAQCVEVHEGTEYCANCYQREFGGKASSRAVTALVLAIVGMNCLWPLGIVSIIMATQEIAAIDRGESPAKGRPLAKGALILGWILVALTGIAVVAGIIFAVAMAS
ncbi:DUF4190 domain-containing protein [Hyalangium rubrum]|uniref:DUF4190 domain-containing protein n=1 Tax=Hyalangium rubrum TaxID=3103134 RepID=A0ABU5HAN2_9BACT|nr:DUF4190 domain-containing protein [Hyalangium sp. s54d21]MDY7229180.1 DUF4190 domain-containing protein [Hyalangium sp. s54d21]